MRVQLEGYTKRYTILHQKPECLCVEGASVVGIFTTNYGFCRQIYIISILGRDGDWRKWGRYIFKRCFQLTRTQFWSPLRHSACTSTFSGYNLRAVWTLAQFDQILIDDPVKRGAGGSYFPAHWHCKFEETLSTCWDLRFTSRKGR